MPNVETDTDTQTTQALALTDLQAAAAPVQPDALTLVLPPGLREVTITRRGFDTVMGAAAELWVRNLPDDPLTTTLHLSMKAAARGLLWYMARRPLPGMPEPPRLTRRDDAMVVVVRFMLGWFFSMALRKQGGVIRVDTLAADAAIAGGSAQLNGWDDFTTAVAGLVSGPAPTGEPTTDA